MAQAHPKLKTTITKTRTIKPRPKRSLTVDYSTNGGQAEVIKVERNKLMIELAMQI